MGKREFPIWIKENHMKFVNLTNAVNSILVNILTRNAIPYLAVSGRTKDVKSCTEKSSRKNYTAPESQMTDISGLRIILYSEKDVISVSRIIESSFRVDKENSLDKGKLLSTRELGYRSVHYVCDLGDERVRLPEYVTLKGLKFEIQVRTVLQHAWAELSHDRHYKFSGQLPATLERKLFLLSGNLESADNNFSDLLLELKKYSDEISDDTEINSVSLPKFMDSFARKKSLLARRDEKDNYVDVIEELKAYGIKNIGELKSIMSDKYIDLIKFKNLTYHGIIRDSMIINDIDNFLYVYENLNMKWALEEDDINLYQNFLNKMQIDLLRENIDVYYMPDEMTDNFEENSETSN